MSSFVPVELSGTPRRIGYQRGRIFRDIIRSRIETRLTKYGNKRDAQKELRLLFEVLNVYKPELIDELKGMAEGAKLNCENFLCGKEKEKLWPANGCSAVALTESLLGPVLGTTVDIGRSPYMVLTMVKPSEGYDFICMHFADEVGLARGMNEKGLCIGAASSDPNDNCEEKSLSGHTSTRILAQYCATVQEGIDLLKKHLPLSFTNNVMLVDVKGDAAVIERSHTKIAVRRSVEGGIAVTNFFASEEMRSLEGYDTQRIRDSKARYETCMQFIRTSDRNNPVRSMMNVIRSHNPGGICGHGPPTSRLSAGTALIMFPQWKILYISQPIGPYCQSRFIRYEPFAGA